MSLEQFAAEWTKRKPISNRVFPPEFAIGEWVFHICVVRPTT